MSKDQPMQHGGKRTNAGRKPSGRKSQSIYVTDAEHEQVKALIAKLRITK